MSLKVFHITLYTNSNRTSKNAFKTLSDSFTSIYSICFNSENTGKSAIFISFPLGKFLIRPCRRPWKVLMHHIAPGYLIIWKNGVPSIHMFLLSHPWLWPLPKVNIILLPYKGKQHFYFSTSSTNSGLQKRWQSCIAGLFFVHIEFCFQWTFFR